MPRTARAVEAGISYHVLNRGNGRRRVFHTPGDYDAFCRVLAEGLARFPSLDLLAWCLMPNHWHLVLRPRGDAADLSRLMGWVGVTHVRRHHEAHRSRGGGHLYQGRFKSFPVQDDGHLPTVCRYVEANALRARLVTRAERWRWCSLAGAPEGVEPGAWPAAAAWPVERPRHWASLVNQAVPEATLTTLRESVNRGRPFGSHTWVVRTAARLGLAHTLRGPGRPPKAKPGNKVKA